ncbi:MAG TPA: hypothetical protein V6D29_05095 [Leptolyngbyaceae cyanobacterium]
MKASINSVQEHEHAWIIAVPKRQEFTQPSFHFGERVKFCQGQGSDRTWETGRITGMHFVEEAQWLYSVLLDDTSALVSCGVQEVTAAATELKLVQDSYTIRAQLQSQSLWLLTAEAALQLGLTASQLRKLRLNGLFKRGHHYRDISVPNSGLPRWQWHVERCNKAIENSGKRRFAH